MATFKNSVLATVLMAGLLAFRADALKCFVGSGNASIVLPSTEDELMKHEREQSSDTTFKIMECGRRNAEVPGIERVAKNVFDKIQRSITELLGGNERRKRQNNDYDDDDDNYACAKVLLDGTAYRSCLPRLSNLRLNCTVGTQTSLAVCYCHEDFCNNANVITFAFTSLAFSLIRILL